MTQHSCFGKDLVIIYDIYIYIVTALSVSVCVCVCFAASADLLYADSLLQSCRNTCSYSKFLPLALGPACIATRHI